jgi:tetratricopeptide (TPR) repeat protein
VELLISSTGWAATTLTDDNGEFKFAGLTPASYHLTVTAPACERLEGTVTVDGSVKTLFLRVYRSQQPPTPRSDSVVSVQELRGSGKAESAFAKGTRMLQQGDAQGSIAYFRRALARDPSNYRAYHNLGLANYQLGHAEQAEGDFQKSIELSNGGYAPSQFGLAMVLCENQEFREAERLIQNGLAMEPGSAIGRYFLGVVQFALDRTAEAEKSAQEALWRNANQAEAYILLAKIHERNHNPYAVVAEVAAYLKLDPHGPLENEASKLLQRARQKITESGL